MMHKPSTLNTRKFAGTGAALVCALVFLFTPFSPMPTQTAHGQWAVAVIQEQPFTGSRLVDALAWTTAKIAVQSMTQSIVTWINSGFDGSPAFVSDLNRNLGNLADAVAEDFLIGLDSVVVNNTGFSIRAPFQDQITAALREEFYRTTSSYGFNARHPYTDCYNGGDFSFDGWFCQSQNPANNPYGRYMLARNELWQQIDTATRNRMAELDWGNGFLSWRGLCGNQTAGPGGVSGPVDLNQRDQTVGCSIRTPGTVIEDQLVESLGSPIRQLEIADSMNEIVAALMSQMVNQVLGGNGLSGLSQPAAGGGRSYLDQATNSAASLGAGFSQGIAEQRAQLVEARAGWQRIANAAATARQECSSNSSAERQASDVLTLATSHAAQTTTLISSLDNIQARTTALRNDSSAESTAVMTLINDYQSMLSQTGTLMTGITQSQETGDSEPSSLYSQMVQLERSCR